MEITRYIMVKAVKTNDNELIPIWDSRLTYEKPEFGSKNLKVDKQYDEYHSLVDAIFDLKTKEITSGIELDYYPSKERIGYKKGEFVMQELKGRVLRRQQVVDIVYEDYELTIGKGSKLTKYWNNEFKFDANLMYTIKSWKPYYILDNGDKIEWEHELYKIQE